MTDQLYADPQSIYVDRETRQRKVIKIDDLIPSIRDRGVLQPIIIEPYGDGTGQHIYKLIAGERRLTTAIFLNLSGIPARLFSELSELDRELIEFEENVKRQDLTWQERAEASMRIHRIYSLQAEAAGKEEWTETESANAAGLHAGHFMNSIAAAEALAKGDKSIAECTTLSAAVTILQRRRERAAQAFVASVLETEEEIAPTQSVEVQGTSSLDLASINEDEVDHVELPAPVAVKVEPEFLIRQADMVETLANWNGRRFNFLHCDLPYGVPLNGMANQGAFEGGGYDSNPDIYFELLSALATSWDKFMLPQSHIMFWISMEFYEETLEFFRKNLPWLTMQASPLIWGKTDNKGIIPDALRGPRRIYEACLFGSSGDRKIVKPVGNFYPCPSSKEIHTNEKPQPMLNHFLSMFVDDTTRILDPTCGSGSAIRSAANLGASYGLGLEHNPEFAERASTALANQIKLANLAKKV